jgi:hypothetical protein
MNPQQSAERIGQSAEHMEHRAKRMEHRAWSRGQSAERKDG